MAEHYTRNTLECTAWCGRCDDFTQHRVDGGRRGPCLGCIARLEQEIAQNAIAKAWSEALAEEQQRRNPSLFGGQQ